MTERKTEKMTERKTNGWDRRAQHSFPLTLTMFMDRCYGNFVVIIIQLPGKLYSINLG